jgi:hypothetical protein
MPREHHRREFNLPTPGNGDEEPKGFVEPTINNPHKDVRVYYDGTGEKRHKLKVINLTNALIQVQIIAEMSADANLANLTSEQLEDRAREEKFSMRLMAGESRTIKISWYHNDVTVS